MHAKKWEETKRDLTAALLQDVDISTQFQDSHESIAAFEEKIGVQLPENIVDLLNSNPKSFEIAKDARIVLAMKYYENEELSSGLASRLAGISRGVFIMLMGDYGLSPFGTTEDLKAEFENVHKSDKLNYDGNLRDNLLTQLNHTTADAGTTTRSHRHDT